MSAVEVSADVTDCSAADTAAGGWTIEVAGTGDEGRAGKAGEGGSKSSAAVRPYALLPLSSHPSLDFVLPLEKRSVPFARSMSVRIAARTLSTCACSSSHRPTATGDARQPRLPHAPPE